MSSPEKFFCTIVQAQYDATVAVIESYLLLTPQALRLLKSSLNFYKVFTLDVIDTALTYWENRFLSFGDLLTKDFFDKINTSRLAFCRAAYVCNALREVLFPEDENDPTWVANIPKSVRDTLRLSSTDSTYEVFEKFVCKLSLRSIMDGFRTDFIDELDSILDGFLNQLGINKIDQFIADYFNALGDIGIFEQLNKLQKYSNCFFEVCNFVETSINYKENVGDKLQLETVGDGWQFKATDSINSIYTKETEIRSRIAALKSKLTIFRGDGTTGSGTGPDDIFKE